MLLRGAPSCSTCSDRTSEGHTSSDQNLELQRVSLLHALPVWRHMEMPLQLHVFKEAIMLAAQGRDLDALAGLQ